MKQDQKISIMLVTKQGETKWNDETYIIFFFFFFFFYKPFLFRNKWNK